MQIIPRIDPCNTSDIDNIHGSGCLSDNGNYPLSHTSSPRVTGLKYPIHSRYNTQNYNDRFKKTAPIMYRHLNELSHTKPRVFPERYIHKYEVTYRTTNTDEYIHPKIKEKFEKLRIPRLDAYSSSDKPNTGLVRHNRPKNSNKKRELSKEKPILVGKVYSMSFGNNSQVTNKTIFDNSQVTNNNQFADWNNPTKIHSTLKSL